jgi:hypothetical protein
MKKIYFTDNYYQVAVIAFNRELGKGEYKRVHVLAESYTEAVKRARLVNDFDYESFNMFLLQYRFIKDVLLKEYHQLQKSLILRFYFEACLRTWQLDCRTDETVSILHRTANRVVSNYVRNRSQQ